MCVYQRTVLDLFFTYICSCSTISFINFCFCLYYLFYFSWDFALVFLTFWVNIKFSVLTTKYRGLVYRPRKNYYPYDPMWHGKELFLAGYFWTVMLLIIYRDNGYQWLETPGLFSPRTPFFWKPGMLKRQSCLRHSARMVCLLS